MSRVVFLGFYLFVLHYSAAQNNFLEKRDLHAEWMVYTGNSYKSFASHNEKSPSSVYFILDTEVFKGDKLRIESNATFSVFCDGALLQDQKRSVDIFIDSLSGLFNKKSVLIGIHQHAGINGKSLKTLLVTELPPVLISETGPLNRYEDNFQNFIVVSILILIIFYAVMLRFNPKLTAHCFSAPKLFSLREGEDSQSLNRIGNWGNILFYVFTSFLTGIALIFFKYDQALESFRIADFPELLLLWVEISILILTVFFVKAFLLRLLTLIFNLSDQMGFQFLNFMRMVSISMILMMLLVLSYSALVPEGGLVIFFNSILWLLLGWLVLVFIKLMNRVRASVFHLFSYICITELIPILLIVKVLYE